MIKSLEIKNVLSHKDAKLEFCNGVNMIIGPSDHGKSAILHAFNWGAFNRPTGEAHRNWDGGTMLSKISFTEGGSVTLEKDKQGKYTVKNAKNKAKTFTAFGSNPPQEVPDILNLNQKINIQTQFEPIFLISESPGEVAKFFSEVAGLELINTTIANGKSDLLQTDNQYKVNKTLITEKGDELKDYTGLDTLEESLIDGTRLQDKILLNDSFREDLLCSFADIEYLKNQNDSLKKKTKIKGKVTKAERLFVLIDETEDTLDSFTSDKNQIIDIQNQTEYIQSKGDILSEVDMALVLFQVIQERKVDINSLNGDINSIKYWKKDSANIKRDTDSLQYEFKELMGDTCPLCNQGVS